MGIPYEKKNASKSRLLRLIKKYWPSPRSVQKWQAGKQDVNRKTLLILYLATEGMGIEIPEDRFVEEHFRRINLMLSDCGMALLNLHNPFDYLVLQCLHLEDEDDFMSRRMERFSLPDFQGTGADRLPPSKTSAQNDHESKKRGIPMNQRTLLPDGSQLKSSQRTYIIQKYISAGSNSIVYQAYYQDTQIARSPAHRPDQGAVPR